MEKWTGIIGGTNRGLILLDLDINKENKVAGSFKLYDAEDVSLTGKIIGELNSNSIVAKLFDFTPKQEGIPTEGTVNFTISTDKKEMRGQWQTNIDTKGECILYKFSASGKQLNYSEPNLTLETKDISIYFSTFNNKNIEDIFSVMTNITKTMREGKEQEILPPIYSITYDKEERIRTYSLSDFLIKFNEAEKIWYVGFEFRDKTDLKNILINIFYQENLAVSFRSNVVVESTDKDIVMMIPEMVRGLVSKTRNKNFFWHHWLIEASIQVFAVITIFALSFLISRKLALTFPSQLEPNRPYIFVISLIILSNLWTYFFRLVFNYIHKSFPIVEIINKPKNKVLPGLFIGMMISVFASAIGYCIKLLWGLLF